MTASGRLAALDAAATPGTWAFSDSTDSRGRKGEFRAPSPFNGFMLVGPWVNDADAPLMVALRNALPEIVAVVRAAEDVVSREISTEPNMAEAAHRGTGQFEDAWRSLSLALAALDARFGRTDDAWVMPPGMET